MSLPTIQPRPFRVLYTFTVILVTLFVMAFMWFILYAGVSAVRAGILTSMTQYDVENSTYSSFELADTFINNLWVYFLVLLTLGLLYWVYIYSQRKGTPVVMYQ